MNWFAILITVLVLAMMIGPVMLLQPNKRQKRLAQLRTRAAQLGLHVKMAKFENESIAVYEKPWNLSEKQKSKIVEWRLQKMSYEHDIHVAKYWQLTSERPLPESIKDSLQDWLERLPEGVQGIEVTRLGARCYWNEMGGLQTLESLQVWLTEFANFMVPYISRPSID